jgi:hypothetical protein
MVAALLALATPAHALRVATWNITNYPSVSLAARQPLFRTVIPVLNPDVLLVQELESTAGRDSFLNNVLNVVAPGQWASTSVIAIGDEVGTIFYKPAKVSIDNIATIAVGGPRPVYFGIVKPVGYTSTAAWFRAYSIHLKAGGPGTPDSTTRRNEGTNLRINLNNVNIGIVGPNFLIGGDSNFYGGYEGGYQRLVENQLDNDGRSQDPLVVGFPFVPPTGNWHVNSGMGLADTQCPCNTGCNAGFSGGGLDDRFDLLLTALPMQDGEGLDYVAQGSVTSGAYPFTFGNDGQHFDTDVNAGGFNNAVGITVANALHDASDHLPVCIVLQLPAKIIAASQLNFGNVIVGGTAQQNLNVANGATDPADELDYTMAAPAGFTAPTDPFQAFAGVPGNDHTIEMSTASSGVKTGTLTVSSDAPDSLLKSVLLSGTVLEHAEASLDSVNTVLASLVDFGDQSAGAFLDQAVRVHNHGYDALQARLNVSAGVITGGAGRFSIVGGFTPGLLAGVGKTYNVHFDDTGATQDSVYNATLTFTSADEALPGSQAQPNLVITLRAKPTSGTTGVDTRPTALSFAAPYPNPMGHETWFGFDLPNPAKVSLAIYDLGGRRVATIAQGELSANRYRMRWDTRDEHGATVPAGLYFARFETLGLSRTARLIVLP